MNGSPSPFLMGNDWVVKFDFVKDEGVKVPCQSSVRLKYLLSKTRKN